MKVTTIVVATTVVGQLVCTFEWVSCYINIIQNEEVIVNLQARGWVVGIVLATVKLANAVR
jgi:hypothetical protein